LEQAEESEKLYENQKDKAKAENRLDLFVNKNKGKQFKLRFIFKAWQLMYFKKQYQIEKEGYAELEKLKGIPKNYEHEFGHHKKFNINRKEFNLFSKWLFAMDEVPEYKNSLKELLDDKNFFDNSEFQKLFESSSNINQFYESTKSKFKNWLNDQQVRNVGKTIQPENYYKMMEVGNFHINLSHFIAFGVTHNFIEKSGKNILRPITSHAKYLNTKIYDIDLEHSDASNLEKNIFRKLYKIRLEDCLLYEIALRYFQPNLNLRQKSYEQLNKLLVQKISITIKANNSQTYQVLVPFRDLEKFEQLKAIDDNTQNNFSLLRRLPEYLSQLRKRNENVFGLKDMVKAFGVDKSISLADMSMLYNHLITQQGRYTNCIMALEEYFIWKEECTIEGQEDKKFTNWIDVKSIPTLMKCFEGDKSRNNAFHMDLPLNETYKSTFKAIEKQFVASEKIHGYSKLEDCPSMLKNTLKVFMNQMHDEIKLRYRLNDTKDEKKRKRERAENTFFEQLLKGY
jgi:hypothetical protein